MLEALYIMNDYDIGEIEDVIGRLGDIEGDDSWIAEECSEILFAIIKPYILDDIKNNDNLDHIQVVGDEHL